jgi:hypothetical protein
MSVSDRVSEVHSLHFDLSRLPAETPFMFHVGMRDYPLLAHTDDSRDEARESNRFLRLLPHDAITHRAEVAAPSDAVALGWATRPVVVDGIETRQVVSMSLLVPREVRLRDVRRGHLLQGSRLHPKLRYRRLGGNLLHSDLHALESAPDQIADFHDAYETAVALLFHHPELMNLNAGAHEGGPVTVIEECVRKALDEYDLLPEMILEHAADWSTMMRVMDDGKPAVDDQGKPLFTMDLHPEVKAMIANPLSRALVYAKQVEGLKGQLWSLQYGITKSEYSGAVKPKPKMLEAEVLRAAADVRWRLKNLTPSSGLVLEDVIPFTPALPGSNWRAEGTWSSQDDKSVGPFTPEMQKVLADGKLSVVFDELKGVLVAESGSSPKNYTVQLSSPASARKASGTCRLNADGTALQYLLTSSHGPFPAASFAAGEPPRPVHQIAVRDGGSNGTMMVKAKNHWLRHLSAYVEFLDPAGNAKAPPNWETRFPVPLADALYDSHPTKRYLDFVNPVEAMMGIPLPADTTHLSFPIPSDASMVRITWGGLGSGKRDPVACAVGENLTVTMEMALPVIMLAAGAAATSRGGFMAIIKEKPVLGAILVALAGAYVGLSDDPGKATLTIGKKLLPAIAKAGLGKLSQAIAEAIAVGAAKRAVPFLNVAFLLADIAATAASLGQTATAIRDSPRAHVTEITRSIDLKVTITSSRIWKKFPDHHHHVSVVVAYDSGTTLPALTKELPNTTISDDIVVEFKEVPAAGNLRVLVFFYAENGWQSGQGASAWMKAEGNTAGSPVLTVPPIEIDVNEVPLGKWSVYEHMEKIGVENGKHVWKASPPPTATKFSKATGPGVIEKLHSITVAQFPQMVGYAWQATELNVSPDDPAKPATNRSLFTVQNLSLLQSPESAYAAPNVGFTNPGGIAYDIVSPDDGSGRNFFIDPTRGAYDETGNPAGGFHLRRVRVSFKGPVPEYKPRTNESWGRFLDGVDSMVIHPHGYVFAIRRGTNKIFRLQIPDIAVPDSEATMASMFSSEGTRDGLIRGPVAITLALDGRVLVLEGSNERAQCFDIHGNPVAYFTDPVTRAATPVLSVRRDERMTLLDMAVEAKGHIFVLGHSGDGRKPADYRVDLYDPSGAFLTSTRNFTAARITVDLLRNLFALNYEVLLGRNGRTEPSISHWRPPAPPRKGEA